MINPQELRIGNYFSPTIYAKGIRMPSGAVGKIQTLRFESVEWVHYNQIPAQVETWPITLYSEMEPIPLNPEWLERFGFNKHNCLQSDIMWRHPHDKKSVEKVLHCLNFYWQDKAFIFIEIVNDHGEYGTHPIGHIKYVHQLQNLYFALTGEELTVTPPIHTHDGKQQTPLL